MISCPDVPFILRNLKAPVTEEPRTVMGTDGYVYPGLEATLEGSHVFPLEGPLPLAPSGIERRFVSEPMKKLPREVLAHIEDWNLWRMSQAEAILTLLMGEVLAELNRGKLSRLGYVLLKDFCREELGISGRLAEELMRNAAMLRRYLLAKDAYVKGQVNRSGLRHLLQVLEPDIEEQWVTIARMLSVRGLSEKVKQWKELTSGSRVSEECLRGFFGDDGAAIPGVNSSDDAGEPGALHGAPDDDDEEGEKGSWICQKMPPLWAALWDYAMETFRRMEEADLPQYEFVEALLAEYFTSFPAGYGERCSRNPGAAGQNSLEKKGREEADEDHENRREDEAYLQMLRETGKVLEEITDFWSFLPWNPVQVLVSESIRIDPSWMGDPFVMAQKLKHMQRLRHRIAFHQGRILKNMKDLRLWRELMFASLGQYARERLGISRNTLAARINMEKSFLLNPDLGEGFFKGTLTQEQTRLLMTIFHHGTFHEDDWIGYAQSVTALELAHMTKQFVRLYEQCYDAGFTLSPWELRCYLEDRGSGSGDEEKEHHAQNGAEEVREDPEQEGAQNCAVRKIIAQAPEVTVRLYLPREVKELWDRALGDFERRCAEIGEPADPALFLMTLVHNFLDTWPDRREKSSFHRKVLERDNYGCQVPVCSCRLNIHAHHLKPRSRGGSNRMDNGSGLCEAHHLHCLHDKGYIKVEGTAPGSLTFTLGVRPGAEPFAVFYRGIRVNRDSSDFPPPPI